MMKLTALQILRILPRENCKKCGKDSCMAYAMKLSEGEAKIEECRKLTKRQKNNLIALLSPKVEAVEVGGKNHQAIIGGEEVLYRHEYRFVNKTKVFIEVSDSMGKDEVGRRIAFVKNFVVERIGEKIAVDGIALSSASGKIEKFKKLAKHVKENYPGPIVLSSFNPLDLEEGAKIFRNRRPILFSATNHTWKEILKIAEKYDASFAVYSEDPGELAEINKKISRKGFRRLLIDARTNEVTLRNTVNKLTIVRKSATEGKKEFGYPIIASTAAENYNPYDEALLASVLVNRYASAIIMRTTDPGAMLNVLTLIQSLYSDPRIEPMVESKLYSVCEPNRESPIFMTSNFALTYYSVLGDLEKAKIPSYILPIDTSGLAVTVSVAADILTAQKVKDALLRNKVAEKVDSRKIIIPGFAARLKDSIEETTGWTVIVGPQDSSQIPEFLKKA